MERPFWTQLLFRAGDALEPVFGPDPALLRLRFASRTALSAALTLTPLLLLTGGAGTGGRAAIALGLMVSNFANVNVRDPTPAGQAATLATLVLPALGCVLLASFLLHWPPAADAGFTLIAMGAMLARSLGPRAVAVGMVAFISYFVGIVTRPGPAAVPVLAAASAISLCAVALARFAILRDRPFVALRRLIFHIHRRIDRILSQAQGALADHGAPGKTEEVTVHRMHYEIARLNDALLVAQDQIEVLEHPGLEERERLSACLFRLELSAERLMRMAADHSGSDRARAGHRISALRDALSRRRSALAVRADWPRDWPALIAAIDHLEGALADLVARSPRAGHAAYEEGE